MSCHGLKMAYRNLLKYKLQSVICVLGLAGGLSCFTVCNYMLRKELAWNKQLPHYGETYKLVTIRENGEVDGLVSLDLAEQLKQEFPEIENRYIMSVCPGSAINYVSSGRKMGNRQLRRLSLC